MVFRRKRRRFGNLSSARRRRFRSRRTNRSSRGRRYFFNGRDKATFSGHTGMLYRRRTFRRRMNRRQRFQVQLADAHGLQVYNSLGILSMFANPPVAGAGSVGLSAQASLNRFALADIQTQFSLSDRAKIFITQQTDTFDLQNQTNSDVYIDVYQTMCKLDNGAGDLGTLYTSGINDLTGTATGWSKPGFTPFDAVEITRYHKILRVKKLRLKLGERRQIMFNRRPYKWFNFRTLEIIAANNFFAGITYSYLFVITGTPADTEATDLINNVVAKVSCTFSLKTYFKQISTSVNTGHFTDSRGGITEAHAYVLDNNDELIVTN